MIFKKPKVVTVYKIIKYLIIFLLMFGLIGDLFFSPTFDIKIHLGNLIIGSLILFVCWFKIKEGNG
jgi:hypothetical protein